MKQLVNRVRKLVPRDSPTTADDERTFRHHEFLNGPHPFEPRSVEYIVHDCSFEGWMNASLRAKANVICVLVSVSLKTHPLGSSGLTYVEFPLKLLLPYDLFH